MAPQHRRLSRVAAAACTTVLVMAGLTAVSTQQDPNNVEDLPPEEIAEKAIDATKGADSLRIEGSGRSDQEEIRIDFAVDKEGDCAGTVGINGGTGRLVIIGDITYVNGDDAFWTKIAEEEGVDAQELINLLDGRWLKVPPGTEGAGDMAEFCDINALVQELETYVRDGVSKGREAEVDGKPAITLTKEEDGATTDTYVATEDKPYILRVVTQGGDGPGDLTLTDYDQPVSATAPSSEDVVDVGQLE
ncbi:hypothetical protein SAMN04487981_103158 [Streptomyces sp. cf386]|uniref:hypothetical protein n=1 Tax=Streptomyces sp. cf386 TaxID=1761904 RepID=UPI000885B805|nr:hypothetical protein [Streptomyces sp. cf386]SDM98409.1 hypothetical protein SAMN04487981_103158 [Streptomyces sp. cf386]